MNNNTNYKKIQFKKNKSNPNLKSNNSSNKNIMSKYEDIKINLNNVACRESPEPKSI